MASTKGKSTTRRQFLKSAVLSGAGMAAGGIDLTLAAATASGKPLFLAKQGQSSYSILISQDASPSERRAAAELQKFVEEMTGARLPILTDEKKASGDLVLVGDSKRVRDLGLDIASQNLGAEGFTLRTVGRQLIIAGGKQRGTMYGVYTFLDKLGCRWFTPDVSVIPKTPALVVNPLDETHKPAFEYREPFFAEAMDKDWAARNRVNGSFLPLDASTGGKVSYHPFVHSFNALLPPKEYFREHPEYYSLVDGKRRGGDVLAQLCLTNSDVLRITIQTVQKWIEQYPEASIFSVSQNDTLNWCECENCRRVEEEEGGAHSGPILRFVNAVAEEIAKTHPDKLIDTLAYLYSEAPPLNVRPHPNVRIRLCPIGACNGQPYDRCVHNRYFTDHLHGWAKITNQLYIWHYVTNFRHFLLPYPNFDELAADVPMYKKNGVVGIFMEGDAEKGGGAENAELRSYVLARLLWNPETNVDATVNEFMAAFYGKSAKAMRAYFDLQHRQVRLSPQGEGRHFWISSQPSAPYLSKEFLADATKVLGDVQIAADDDTVRRRVRKARLSIDYVKLMRAKAFSVRGSSYAPENIDQLKKDFQALMANARSFGITQLHEGKPLEKDEVEFAKYMKPYPVNTLENSALRVVVAPDLSGRTISMIDKSTGADFVRHADPGEARYPDFGGLSGAVYADHVMHDPYDAVWQLDGEPGPLEIRLTAICANGLKIQRTIRLAGDQAFLHTETTVENTATAPVNAVLNSSCEFSPKFLAQAAVVFRSRAGKSVHYVMLPPGGVPDGVDGYAESDLPDGEWSLTGVESGRVFVTRFPNDQVVRCALKWSRRKEVPVTMSLWSAHRALAPGETITLVADYGVTGA